MFSRIQEQCGRRAILLSNSATAPSSLLPKQTSISNHYLVGNVSSHAWKKNSPVLIYRFSTTSSLLLAKGRAPLPPSPRIPPGGWKTPLIKAESAGAGGGAGAGAGAGAGSESKKGLLMTANFWGYLGAIAGWGMSGAAIYDSLNQGPEIISLNMTGVLIFYSSLFCRWALVVQPQNLPLAACHATNVLAQCNQLRRAMEHKLEKGQKAEVQDMAQKGGVATAGLIGLILAGPTIQSALVSANIPLISSVSAAAAGPFTVHFWAPMSKWCISGASFIDLERPTDKISLAQYSALTATGFFFMPYALLVTPLNWMLFAVNAALFGSSAWHLARKVNADYMQKP